MVALPGRGWAGDPGPASCCGLHSENRPKGERKGNHSTMKGTRWRSPACGPSEVTMAEECSLELCT